MREEGDMENESRSTLVIKDSGPWDQGTYTCRPLQGEFKSAYTRLFMDTSTGGSSGTDRINFYWRTCLVGLLTIFYSSMIF